MKRRLGDRYGLQPTQLMQIKSLLTPEQQAVQHGEAFGRAIPTVVVIFAKWSRSLAYSNSMPHGSQASGATRLRRRANAGLIEWDQKFQLVKVNPLASWSKEDVWTYIRLHEVPYNSLHDRNYPSIGCTHCTAPVPPGEDPRSGRWKNSGKTECGLHKAN